MGRMGSLLCYILLRTSDKMPSFFCMDFSIFSVGGLAFLFKILYNLKCNTMLRRITMQIFLINAINGGVVHGTENGKKTGCGINLTKPDNIGKFVSGAPMQDIVDITCEKCKMVLAKKLIKESNKELARQLKEEKKMQKHGGMGAAPMGPISSAPTPPPAPARTSVAPPPPAPVPPRAPAAPEKEVQPVFTAYEPPVKQKAAPAPEPVQPAPKAAPVQDDFLSQFAIPSPGAAQEPPKPAFVAPEPAPESVQPAPKAAPVQDDFLSQFAIPSPGAAQEPPKPAFVAPEPAPEPIQPAPKAAPVQDDFLSQFAIPSPGAAQEPPKPAFVAPEPAPEPIQPAPKAAPIEDIDSILSQLSAPAAEPKPAAEAPKAAPMEDIDSILSQLSAPAAEPEPVKPEVIQPEPVHPGSISITTGASDIVAVTEQQMQSWDDVANSLFSNSQPSKGYTASFDEEPAPIPVEPVAVAPSPAPVPVQPVMPESAPIPGEPVAVAPSPAPVQVQPVMPESAPIPVEPVAVTPSPAPVPVQPVMPEPTPIPVEPVAVAPSPAPVPVQPVMPEPASIPVEPVAVAPSPAPVPVQPVMPKPAPEEAIAPPPAQVVDNIDDVLASMQQKFAATAPVQADAPTPAQPTAPVKPNPIFVGYSAQGQPVYQEFDNYGQPIPITQPVYSLPPVQQTPHSSYGTNGGNVFQQAISNQNANKRSVFDMENGNATPPVISSVEDMLSAMGETVTKKKQDDDKVAINFVEYKAPPKQKPAPKATPKLAEPPKPTAPMTKAEAKRQKKLDKINAEFEKQLKARGFDTTEGNRMKRG